MVNSEPEDALLAEKISALSLASTQFLNSEKYQQEALVCALLLLSRISSAQIFLAVFTNTSSSTRSVLADFSLQILKQLTSMLEASSPQPMKDYLQQQVLEKLCRLVSCIMARLFDEQSKGITKHQSTMRSKTSSELLTILHCRRQLGREIDALDLDVLNAILVSRECSVDDEKLFFAWQIYQDSLTKQRRDTDMPQQTSNEDKLMIETLDALLNQNSTWPSNAEDVTDVWHDTMFLLFQANTPKAHQIPRSFGPALQWWVETKQSKEPTILKIQARRAKWAWHLLYILDNSEDTTLVLRESQWHQVMQLLLACAVTTSEEISTLRPLTWTVACRFLPRVLDQVGLDKQVCSLLRLAVGEWNIQLEKTLQRVEELQTPQEIDNHSHLDTALVIVRACGQIVVEMVEWITHIEERLATDESASKPKRMTQSSIKSVTQSLEHSLDICVQFFQQSYSTMAEAGEVVVGVFGALLTEFDCFTGAKTKVENEERTKSLIMALLRTIVFCHDRTELSSLLFPGVATVLASAQGDSARMSYLMPLVDPTIQLIDLYWGHVANSSTLQEEGCVVWVCQMIELSFEMFPSRVEPKLNSWKLELIRLLKESGSASRPVSDAIVGCYVALQGSRQPPDHDAVVIEGALSRLNLSHPEG